MGQNCLHLTGSIRKVSSSYSAHLISPVCREASILIPYASIGLAALCIACFYKPGGVSFMQVKGGVARLRSLHVKGGVARLRFLQVWAGCMYVYMRNAIC